MNRKQRRVSEGEEIEMGALITASVRVSFNFQNSLNPNEECCWWSLMWTNIQAHIERDKQTQHKTTSTHGN